MKCKNCNAEMHKEFTFGSEVPYQRTVCPQCKASTAPREILYDEDGNLSKESGKIVRNDDRNASMPSSAKPNKVNLKKPSRVNLKKNK